VGFCPLFCFKKGVPYMLQRDYEMKIKELAAPVIEAEGMELIYAQCLKMKSRWIVRIFLDKEGGVTLDDCAAVSNQLGDILDMHDVPPGRYILEVSSPGLDRPLERDKDFLKYKGANVVIRIDEKIDGARNFRGKLIDYIDEDGKKTVVLDVAGVMRRIPRDRVTKARLEYEF
jgi:ribosome maturation factor RimP